MSGYVPNSDEARREMLSCLGIDDVSELFAAAPQSIRIAKPLDLPPGKPEADTLAYMRMLAGRNTVFKTIFRGAGAYRHYIPSLVRRIAAKEEFVTAYTPYQAEISQGVLQCIFEFQTMICELTGMDAANASVYDGAVAAAEAVAMCGGSGSSRGGGGSGGGSGSGNSGSGNPGRRRVIVSETVHPHVIATMRTYCKSAGTELVTVQHNAGTTDLAALDNMIGEDVACVLIQQPNFYGQLEDATMIGEIAHGCGAKYIMSVNPISLAVLAPPGECGADIAVGEGQPLGLPLSFGGPYLGFMACKREIVRKLPGRIVGETRDKNGERAFVLTLQAREQHIRREKASSNICTNQAHCALTASAYLALSGYAGLRETAMQCMSKAAYLHQQITSIEGFEPVFTGPFFHEFVTRCPIPPEKLELLLESHGVLMGLPLDGALEGCVLWCATECNSKQEIDMLADIAKEAALNY